MEDSIVTIDAATRALHEIHARRATMQALTVVKLDGLTDWARGRIDAGTLDTEATEMCSCGTCGELGTVCGPPSFGYELGWSCAVQAVETWLSDPERHDPREILSLDVKL